MKKKHIEKQIIMKPDLRKAGASTKLMGNYVNLLGSTKDDYFSKVNPKLVWHNEIFWRTIKSCLSDKRNFPNIKIVSEKDCIISNNFYLNF